MPFAVPAPIGIFDSGYGGLTILDDIVRRLPDYDYIYLGDNARAPYGNRSFDVVYEFTLQSVRKLFSMGCPLVILACNTASAKALRNIQQRDLPLLDPSRRVLGVIRPTVELVGTISHTRHVGVLGTLGTISSCSYPLELQKLFPDISVAQRACLLWASIVEAGECRSAGADFFVRQDVSALLADDPLLDTVILACTHYPLLLPKIQAVMPPSVRVLSQGPVVADSLADYLKRHPEMDLRLSKNATVQYLTTENPERFSAAASVFLSSPVEARRVTLF